MANLHIGITGDGSSAISELARVQAAIDKLSGKTIRIRVDVDGTGKAVADMQGLTKATDDLTRASRAQSRASRAAARATVEHGSAAELAGEAVRRYGGDVDRVGRTVSEAGKSADRTSGDIDRAGRSVDDLGGSAARTARTTARLSRDAADTGASLASLGRSGSGAGRAIGMGLLYATAGSGLLTAGVGALGVASAASLAGIGVGMGAAGAGVTSFAVDSLKEVQGFQEGFANVGRAVQGYSAWISEPYGRSLLRMADASASSAPAIAAPLRQAMADIGDTAERGLPGMLQAAAVASAGAGQMTRLASPAYSAFFRALPGLTEASISPLNRVAGAFSLVADRAFTEGVPAYAALTDSLGEFGAEVVGVGADQFAPTLRGMSSMTDGARSMLRELRPSAIGASMDAFVDFTNMITGAIGNSAPSITKFANTLSANSYGLQQGVQGFLQGGLAIGGAVVSVAGDMGPALSSLGQRTESFFGWADSFGGGVNNFLDKITGARRDPATGYVDSMFMDALVGGGSQSGLGPGGFGDTGGVARRAGGRPGEFSGFTAGWRRGADGSMGLDLPAGAAEQIQRMQNRIDAGGLSAGQVKAFEQGQRYAARGVDPAFAFKGRPGGEAEYSSLLGNTSAAAPTDAGPASPGRPAAGRAAPAGQPGGGLWSSALGAAKDFTFGSLGNLLGGGGGGQQGGSMLGRMLGSLFSGATTGMMAPGLGGGGFGAGLGGGGAARMTDQMRTLASATNTASAASRSFGTATSGAMGQATTSSAGVSTMRTQVQSMAPAIQAARAAIVPAATSVGAAIPQAVGTAAATPAPVTSAMRGVVRTVQSMTGAAGDAGQSMGAAMGTGAGAGVTRTETKTMTIIRRWVKKIVDTGMDALDAHSPSRVFMGIGGFIGDGLALGVQQSSAGAISATRQMGLAAGMAGSLGAAMGTASDGVRGVASDRGLQVGYSWARSVVDGADRVLKTADFKAAGIPQIESPLAKTALGQLGLLGPAGSGAQIWKTPMVTLGGDGAAAPAARPVVVNVNLDGAPFRQYTAEAIDTFAEQLADSIGRQAG